MRPQSFRPESDPAPFSASASWFPVETRWKRGLCPQRLFMFVSVRRLFNAKTENCRFHPTHLRLRGAVVFQTPAPTHQQQQQTKLWTWHQDKAAPHVWSEIHSHVGSNRRYELVAKRFHRLFFSFEEINRWVEVVKRWDGVSSCRPHVQQHSDQHAHVCRSD